MDIKPNAKVKITVLKRLMHKDILEQYADSIWDQCGVFSVGQEFIADGTNMPEGFFCGWAWSDIEKIVLTLSRGGNFSGVPKGTFVTCCTDGYRPVIFKVERLED